MWYCNCLPRVTTFNDSCLTQLEFHHRPHFSESPPGSSDFTPGAVRRFVSLLFGRMVDRHSGGYQRNGKRRFWTGVNFHKMS